MEDLQRSILPELNHEMQERARETEISDHVLLQNVISFLKYYV